MKKTYDQVKSDHVQMRGEKFALTANNDSRVYEISRELDQGKKMQTTPKTIDPFPELSEIGSASPPRSGLVFTPSKMNAGRTPDNCSIQEGSVTFQDEDDNGRPVEACPMSSVPDVGVEGSDAAWRATVLPILTTSPDQAVWEVSERYTGWLSACHIKLGVTGAASQTFFFVLIK